MRLAVIIPAYNPAASLFGVTGGAQMDACGSS